MRMASQFARGFMLVCVCVCDIMYKLDVYV